ncbi:MAG: hypothetical protein CVU56_18380 [Deltaproteobacteria bacterium HGW-Deltaproteobacteria-14]|jgi:hypothetical protein|nr:MAG: hypothetical protein CVU56_18380 [Deltaproteobacteria bacterium HGW-Deltaproteobacteria-14]
MSANRAALLVLLVATAPLAACMPEDQGPACTFNTGVATWRPVVVPSQAQFTPTTDAGFLSARITGTLDAIFERNPDERFPIDAVRVAGVPATATAANFGAWEVRVPGEVLRDPDYFRVDRAELPVTIDFCGRRDVTTGTTVLVVPVRPASGAPVPGLDLDPLAPRRPALDSCDPGDADALDHLPTGRTVLVDATVRADTSAAGAAVRLRAPDAVRLLVDQVDPTASGIASGTLYLPAAAQATVTLVFDGAKASGDRLWLQAEAGGQVVEETLFIAPAPVSDAPADKLVLKPGASDRIAFSGTSLIARCRLSGRASVDLRVILGNADLGETWTCVSPARDRVELTVESEADAEDGAQIEVSCQDIWGQTRKITVTVGADD